MKLKAVLVAVAVGLLPGLGLAATTYTLDPFHTNINWKASHFGYSSPSGKFTKSEGSFTLDDAKPEASTLTVTIYTDSLITGIPKFDEHLKSKDFLNVAANNKATFVSTKVVKLSDQTADVEGNFTLNGVTKPLTLHVTLNKVGISPASNKQTAGFSATAVIKRSEYGITYAVPGVSDEVIIEIEVEGSAN